MMLRARCLLVVSAIWLLPVVDPPEEVWVAGADRGLPSARATDNRPDAPLAAEGVVERYILDPRGEVEGLILADGSQLYVTSRAAGQLTGAIKPGDHVQVHGRRKPDESLVHPDLIKNVTRGTMFTVPLRLDLPMPEQEHRLSVREMSATGTIRLLLYHSLKGNVTGMVLSDETQVRLPPDVGEEFRRSLHVGDSVTIKGNGTKNQFGRAIEAVAMGRDSASLVSLDASLRHLP